MEKKIITIILLIGNFPETDRVLFVYAENENTVRKYGVRIKCWKKQRWNLECESESQGAASKKAAVTVTSEAADFNGGTEQER